MSLCSVFAKAHEYKCEYINKDGIKCNGMPKLGEIIQVCISYYYLLRILIILTIFKFVI